MGRILALDIGRQRTGVALSDPNQQWVFGRGVIEGGLDSIIRSVRSIIETEGVERIVIGLPVPLRHRSRPGTTTDLFRRYAEKIKAVLDLPVEYEEERLTSRLGERLRHESGRRGHADEQAAQLILQSYLGRKK